MFGIAAVQKGRGREPFFAFAVSLRALGFTGVERPVAYAVIAAEFFVVVLLAAPSTVVYGYVLALVLLTVFAGGILRASRSATPVPCRCFGSGSEPLGARHLVRNTVVAALAVTGLLAGPGPIGAGATLAALGGLAVALVLVRWDDLTFLIPSRRR